MSDILNSKVLVLNSVWQAIGTISAKKALISLNSENNGNVAAKALDIQYEQLDENTFNFENCVSILPMSFEEWIQLPIRPYDGIIHTINKAIRLPTIIVALGFSKMVVKQIRATKKSIFERDNYTCQYTGQKLPRSKLNIDHILPKSKGGGEGWLNLVCCDKNINYNKGNKTNDEAGLKLIRTPTKPLPVPASHLIKEIKNLDWKLFLNK